MLKTLICISLILMSSAAARAQTSTFTYQGRLTDSMAAASGAFDFEFALYGATGNQIGDANTRDDVQVLNGVFTVQLDFGAAAFDGAPRTLGISVRRGAETGAYTALTPRQPITSTPYAIRAVSAETATSATNATQLGGSAASQFVQTADSRLSDARQPAAGSSNYIQNGTTEQFAGFNISGNGIVGGNVGIGTTGAPTARLQVNGGIRARGGAPGADGASNNGYAFEEGGGDNDSGLFSSAAGQLEFYSNNVERLRIAPGEIRFSPDGTASLQVRSNGRIGGLNGTDNSPTSDPGGAGTALELTGGSGGNASGGSGGAGAGVLVNSGNGGRSDSGSGGAGANVLIQGGTGGISLVKNGGDGGSIVLRPGAGGITGNPFNFSPGAGGNVQIAPTNGNVGIGTTSPTSKLHVVGNSFFNGNSVLNGNLTVSGTFSGTLPTGSANYIQNTTTQQNANFNVSGSGTIGGNLTTGGTITSGCRSGFTAIAGGRLCVSGMQTAAMFYGADGAVQTCTNMSARVGNSADAMLTFSNSGFNYFSGTSSGWLADHIGDDLWATWNVSAPTPNFDGAPVNVFTTATALPFRCVY